MNVFGKKTTVGFLVVMVCGALAVGALVGCGSSASSSAAASSAAGSASASASSAPASTSASSTASSTAASSSASASSGVMEIDGVTIKSLGFEMVGDTPNFMVVFSNPTDQAVDVDLSKFQIKVDDKDEVSFHLTSKTIDANKPHAQWAFTAKPDSMKVGDSVTVYYDGNLVGTYEVTAF